MGAGGLIPQAKRTHRASVVVIAAVLLAAGCTGSDPTPATTPTLPPKTTGSAGPGPGTTTRPTLAVTQQRDRVVLDVAAGLQLSLTVADGTVRMTADGTAGPFLEDVAPYLVRSGGRAIATSYLLGDNSPRSPEHGALFTLSFSDGSSAALTVSPKTDRTVQVVLEPDDPTGVTEWGLQIATAPDEAIYGLTERIVDSMSDSEWAPQEVGSLDRKGEVVTMYVTPTISGYAPFYQSSKGYGLLVDGTMPGVYDVGKTDPNVIDLRFELSSTEKQGSFHLFHGPSHAQILDEYTELTGRPPRPPAPVFTTWRGRDEYRKGATAEWHGITINADVARDLQTYEDNGIPPGVFHFDRPWAVGPEGYGDFLFDPDRFPNAAAMLAEMKRVGWHMMVWTSPWAIGALGEEAAAKGYLAPNSTRAIDLTNPDAAAWIKAKLVAFLRGPEGRYIDGFFMDRGEENDVSSQPTDVYHDGRTGREMHNAYVMLFDRIWREAMDEARPDGSGWLIARGAYTGAQASVMRWGGDTHSREGIILPEVPQDLPSTDKGLRSVLISIQRAAFMGTAYWGSDIGGYSDWNDRDLYARWIEVGAVSPIMRFHGKGPAPWDSNPDGSMDAELLAIYKKYVALHADLAPYLEQLAEENSRTGNTLVRPLVFTWPDEPGAMDRWDEWTLGTDVLVAPIWRVGERQRSVWFPPGRWVSWWDRGTVITGPVEQVVDVPLDSLALYAREGSTVLR